MARIVRCLLGLTWILGSLCSCETQKVDPLETTQPRDFQTLTEVMRPLREPKSGSVSVLCDELVVDLSREIYVTDVMKKFSNNYHLQTRDERTKPVVETFRNTTGGLRNPLEFWFHQVRFVVLKSAEFRLHYSGKARFDLIGQGHVEIFEDGAKAARKVTTLEISDGVCKEK